MLGDPIHRPHPAVDGHDNNKGPVPWWRTPSLWLMAALPFSTIATSATIAPEIEVYILLACSVHKPDILENTFLSTLSHQNSTFGLTHHNNCASDPVVRAAVAELTAVISLCVGVLACLTTGWWGSFSDRYGRTRVMGISILGPLLTEFNLIFVARFIHYLPGGYWLLVFGPLVEGCLGGTATAAAALHAYLADTSTESTRSRMFSLSLGLHFTGMALGPSLGGLLIRFTGNTTSVFWAAAVLHGLYGFLVWVVIPESLGVPEMQEARTSWASVGGNMREEGEERENLSAWAARVFAFLSPLAVFSPRKDYGKAGRGDWGLLLIAVSYGFTISITGSYTYKLQYMAATFGWNAEMIGYWLSLAGAMKVVLLTAILPVIMKIFKPKPLSLPVLEAPLLSVEFTPSSGSSSTPPSSHIANETSPLLESPHPARTLVPQPMATPIQSQSQQSQFFDLQLARNSSLIDLFACAGMALAQTPVAFTLTTMAGAMSTGFSPTLQSAALGIYLERKGGSVGGTGKMFGAFSVIQALCSQILGPALYGVLYTKTVTTYPQSIFIVSSVIGGISFGLLTFVRIGGNTEWGGVGVGVGSVEGDEEEELVSGVAGITKVDRITLRRKGTLVDISVGESRKLLKSP